MRRIFIRGACYMMLGLLWSFVAALVLELGARACFLYIERSNPLIVAYRNHATIQDEGSVIVFKESEEDVPGHLNADEKGNAFFDLDASMSQVLAWGPRALTMTPEDRRLRQGKFFELSPQAREAWARLNAEMVFAVDEKGDIRSIYGVGSYGVGKHLFSGIQGYKTRHRMARDGVVDLVCAAIEEARQGGVPREITIPFPNARTPQLYFTLTCLAGESESDPAVVAYLHLDMHPETVADTFTAPMQEKSRLAVPHYRFKPNYRQEGETSFSTNSLGFRSDEVPVPKPPGLFRILCIGGSTTEEGADNDATYPALLQARLRQTLPHVALEVVNAGMPGITSHGHLLRLPEYLRLEPDMVIVHLGVNDLIRCYDWWSVQLLPRQSFFIRLTMPSVFMVSQAAFVQWHRDTMGFNMQLLDTLLQRHGITVAYASMAFPDNAGLSRAERQYYHYQAVSAWDLPAFSLRNYNNHIRASNRILRELSQESKGPYIPVAERLGGGSALFWDFCHMRQTGIAKKADIIYESVLPIIRERMP